ncbi:MAG: glutathione S-transferase [Deltaproteobacteria bacterium]|nr:glutathione S-transferase [Nannocystaceae bacterium]
MDELPKLVVLHVSPWSERVRWALDHHGIAYQLIQHAPFLGEGRLRKLVGDNGRAATVPVLVDGAQVISQSWDIVAHADRHGRGTTLIPAAHEDAIREWVGIVDTAAGHGRALVIGRMLRSPPALDESLPPAVPRWLRPLLRPITRHGSRWFARKYGLDLDAALANERAVIDALDHLRRSLGGRRYLLGELTYADIVVATLLQGIAPVDDEYIRLGPATRDVWTNRALAEHYADLLTWRDALYREHRRAPPMRA